MLRIRSGGLAGFFATLQPMKLTLKLRYRTTFGQSLWVTGNHPLLGDGDAAKAIPLAYLNDEFWHVTIAFPRDTAIPKDDVVYNYSLRQPDGSTTTDWGSDHRLAPALFSEAEVLVVDSWNAAGSPENAFYTEPFREVLLRDNQTTFTRPPLTKFTHTLKVKAPLLARGQTLCLLGNATSLGRWDGAMPVLLNRTPGEDFLSVDLDLAGESFPIEYKYGAFDIGRNAFVAYESGGNRRLDEPHVAGRRIIVNDGFAALPVETWRGAGVAIPVFSLRSENSFGVGEFTDLKPLADWCRQTGLRLIQILPVNDTTSTHTWADSYPYSAISAFALNPIYLNLGDVATARNKPLLQSLEAERQRLNTLPEMDYATVMAAKLDFIKQIFPSQRAATFRSKDYKTFFAENKHWLTPYAVFCFLRDKFGTADSRQWPEHGRCSPEAIAEFAGEGSPHFDGVALHYFIQFHLHRQLQDAAAHAHGLGIILKGDIAIGVSRNGADTWQSPDLYDLSVQAGAPPDPFADKGQNWGFPTYNWPRMQHDGFAWWKQRFAQMGHYFDAFRIDHVLGFFRIWSIPAHAVEGILGHFVPAIPIELAEFSARGIAFDRARFVEPLITDAIVSEIFGSEAEAAKKTYLTPGAPGQYALRTEYATQRLVEEHFALLKPTPQFEKLKLGLFDLISNVLLFEAAGPRGPQFHFRFHMEKTASFRALDGQTQAKLMDLYVDYFFRRQDAFWMKQALQKLPALKRVTNMLICGEDLGLVPACVPDVMKGLGLLSLEIQRMPKTPGRAFSRPSEAPYLSVVTPSTHDMSTIRGWWKEDARLMQRFYNDELGLPGRAPEECDGQLNEAVVRQHLASPAMWSIFQLQDLLGMDETLRRADAGAERINIPANPRHYWRYRMHLTLEALLKADAFNQHLLRLVQEHGR
jgi:4-alpha-glucanotransferase